MRFKRLAWLVVIVALGATAMSAKCLENDALRRGPVGDWHIYGEIHNETDVQGSKIGLVGTLEYPDGSTIVSEAYGTCPPELSPGTFSVYDIVFPDTQSLPRADSYRVNVASGEARSTPLPPLSGQFEGLTARFDLVTPGEVDITGVFDMQAVFQPGAAVPAYRLCIVTYGPTGEVADITRISAGTVPFTGRLSLDALLVHVSRQQVESVRILVWLVDGPDSHSVSAVRATDPIPVQ